MSTIHLADLANNNNPLEPSYDLPACGQKSGFGRESDDALCVGLITAERITCKKCQRIYQRRMRRFERCECCGMPFVPPIQKRITLDGVELCLRCYEDVPSFLGTTPAQGER